ncbi:hypothetical protein [Undibacterium sp. TS12]|uniref:hypothetical protein n=1 Tax=Undibacterium sp. TS12 TaxID=2908202 RepID=UPI001F4CE54E|nr:hypothetical protein [Undibacterium sp. TS12]MCH8622209.1 hypothetical protein [Undibacterium sp. TS12]
MSPLISIANGPGSPFRLGRTAIDMKSGPVPVLAQLSTTESGYLHVWKEVINNTCGFIMQEQAVVIPAGELTSMHICFMRRAKGSGNVSLEANLEQGRQSVTLLETGCYDEVALNWLQDKRGILEEVFELTIELTDDGYDC